VIVPLAHLDWVHRVVGGNLLECLTTADRLHGDVGHELRAVGSAFALGWEPPSQGRCPASQVNDGPCLKNPDHLKGMGLR
jgi:hypothetical protein